MLKPTPIYYFVFSSIERAKSFYQTHSHCWYDVSDPTVVKSRNIEVIKELRRVAVELPREVEAKKA